MAFDTTRLLSQVILKGSLPDGRFEDQELLDLAYDSLLSEIIPVVLDCREDFLVTFKDYPITANQAAYPIPTRALNGVLREVKRVRGSDIIDVDRKDLEEIRTTTVGTPRFFYVSGNDICLYPTPSETVDTLRMYYFIRPSKLVTTAECARISDISGNSVTVTIPTGWTTASTFDLVRGKAHFDILATDLTASSVSGTTITFNAAPPSTLAIGDYVTLAEETCFPFLPPEGHVALVQSTVATALESMGDPNAAVAAQKAAKLLATFETILCVRVQGEPKPLGVRLL